MRRGPAIHETNTHLPRLIPSLAFAKTKSLAAPLGLHLGWNLISYVVCSAGPAGAALLIPASGLARLKPNGLSGFLLGFGLQLALSVIVIVALLRWRSAEAQDPVDQAP